MNITYLPTERLLVLKDLREEGELILTDIRGRMVSRFKVSELKDGMVSVSVERILSSGLYIAKYEGANERLEAKLSIPQ